MLFVSTISYIGLFSWKFSDLFVVFFSFFFLVRSHSFLCACVFVYMCFRTLFTLQTPSKLLAASMHIRSYNSRSVVFVCCCFCCLFSSSSSLPASHTRSSARTFTYCPIHTRYPYISYVYSMCLIPSG